MTQCLMSVDEAAHKISGGRPLLVAGDEQLLRQRPAGNWIGGTIPYFMAIDGGLFTQASVFVTELPDVVTETSIGVYDEESLQNVYRDLPNNGFGIIIVPAFSGVHLSFALNAPNYSEFATKPLIGWVAGVALSDVATETAKVFDGRTGTAHERHALVMRAALPAAKGADIGIVNIFRQGDGDTLVFPETTFGASDVVVNGERRNFAEYLKEREWDIRLPLVADYSGAMINVSIQRIEETENKVYFYAPVFRGAKYRQAQPVHNYTEVFTAQVSRGVSGTPALACNCVLNYLYSELEGKQTGPCVGPYTFGEVAYQLLNQTMAYLTVVDLEEVSRS
jgi:hypothetical protein